MSSPLRHFLHSAFRTTFSWFSIYGFDSRLSLFVLSYLLDDQTLKLSRAHSLNLLLLVKLISLMTSTILVILRCICWLLKNYASSLDFFLNSKLIYPIAVMTFPLEYPNGISSLLCPLWIPDFPIKSAYARYGEKGTYLPTLLGM